MREGNASRVSAEVKFSLLSFVETYPCFYSELRKEVSEETAAKEALQAAYASVQRDYDDLEEAALAACQGAEDEGGQSGSSLVVA